MIVFLIGMCRRAGARRRQCAAGGGPQNPGDRRDARHARDLSRRRHRLCRRPADLGDRPARQLRRRRADACRRPSPLLVWLALALITRRSAGWRATRRTGRNLYALGSNPEGARFAGIGERRHIALLFVLSGGLCGLVGVLWGARFGTVDAVIAPDLQLQAISAAVVGGVSIFGGSGSVYGAAIGVGDLRRAAERRAAARHQPVLAAGRARRRHPGDGDLLQPSHAARRSRASRSGKAVGAHEKR